MMELDYVLTGSTRIVKDELERVLDAGVEPSLSLLARNTGYTEQTVRTALLKLHEWGLVVYRNRGNGKRCHYEVLE